MRPAEAGLTGHVLPETACYCSANQLVDLSNGAKPAEPSTVPRAQVRENVYGRHGLNGFTRP